MLNRKWEEQQVLEIDAEAPYQLHPDSGLIGGAGYIKIKLSGSGKTNHQLFNSMQANHLKEMEQRKEEKIKIKEMEEHKQSEKVGLRFNAYVWGLVALALLYLLFRFRRFVF
ncbi:MAG: hypothetical protein EOO88_27950 [Pedobacter sp.]|nr:MAG: hypothetical protein EOO88_27950 [Pedobacter sp.]